MLEEKYNQTKTNITKKVKNRVFDIIAAGVLLAAIAINLGALEWKELGKINILDLLAEFVPLLLTSMLLTADFYQKGVFYGKASDTFIAISTAYSDLITNLTGKQIEAVSDFCIEYNEDALRKLQEPVLKKVAINYDLYNQGKGDIPPLKTLSKRRLKLLGYDRIVYKAILKCNKMNVKGLKVNNILGNENVDDITDLGKTENELRTVHNTTSAIQYTVSTAFMTLIAIKDIASWGWVSLLLIAFKLIYIFVRSYMSYFNGYNDITVSLNNQLARKTDILKQFLSWYENKVTKSSKTGNNLENS